MELDRRELAAVFAGGVIGTLARAALVEAWPTSPGCWPWPTFAANLAGALLLGWVAAQRAPGRARRAGDARAFLGPGVCSGLTTFSALQLELLVMLDRGRTGLALAYGAASVAGGLLAVRLGARARRPA